MSDVLFNGTAVRALFQGLPTHLPVAACSIHFDFLRRYQHLQNKKKKKKKKKKKISLFPDFLGVLGK